MSENVKETENKNTGEIEKIDILTLIAAFWNGFKKLWIVMLVIVVVCTLRSYFATSFSYTPAVCRVRDSVGDNARRIIQQYRVGTGDGGGFPVCPDQRRA